MPTPNEMLDATIRAAQADRSQLVRGATFHLPPPSPMSPYASMSPFAPLGQPQFPGPFGLSLGSNPPSLMGNMGTTLFQVGSMFLPPQQLAALGFLGAPVTGAYNYYDILRNAQMQQSLMGAMTASAGPDRAQIVRAMRAMGGAMFAGQGFSQAEIEGGQAALGRMGGNFFDFMSPFAPAAAMMLRETPLRSMANILMGSTMASANVYLGGRMMMDAEGRLGLPPEAITRLTTGIAGAFAPGGRIDTFASRGFNVGELGETYLELARRGLAPEVLGTRRGQAGFGRSINELAAATGKTAEALRSLDDEQLTGQVSGLNVDRAVKKLSDITGLLRHVRDLVAPNSPMSTLFAEVENITGAPLGSMSTEKAERMLLHFREVSRSPTTSPDRLRNQIFAATSFARQMGLAGSTGAQAAMDAEVMTMQAVSAQQRQGTLFFGGRMTQEQQQELLKQEQMGFVNSTAGVALRSLLELERTRGRGSLPESAQRVLRAFRGGRMEDARNALSLLRNPQNLARDLATAGLFSTPGDAENVLTNARFGERFEADVMKFGLSMQVADTERDIAMAVLNRTSIAREGGLLDQGPRSAAARRRSGQNLFGQAAEITEELAQAVSGVSDPDERRRVTEVMITRRTMGDKFLVRGEDGKLRVDFAKLPKTRTGQIRGFADSALSAIDLVLGREEIDATALKRGTRGPLGDQLRKQEDLSQLWSNILTPLGSFLARGVHTLTGLVPENATMKSILGGLFGQIPGADLLSSPGISQLLQTMGMNPEEVLGSGAGGLLSTLISTPESRTKEWVASNKKALRSQMNQGKVFAAQAAGFLLGGPTMAAAMGKDEIKRQEEALAARNKAAAGGTALKVEVSNWQPLKDIMRTLLQEPGSAQDMN